MRNTMSSFAAPALGQVRSLLSTCNVLGRCREGQRVVWGQRGSTASGVRVMLVHRVPKVTSCLSEP